MSQQSGRGTIVVTRPRDEDAGQYQCFAQNEHGTATANSVFVRKSELKAFEEGEPKQMTVNEGHPFTLPCQAPDGYPKPKVCNFLKTINVKSLNKVIKYLRFLHYFRSIG